MIASTSSRFLCGARPRRLRSSLATFHAPSPRRAVRPVATLPATPARRGVATAAATAGADDPTTGGMGPAGRVFFSSLCLLTFGLGTWQTRRYFEKIEMTRRREDDLRADPLLGYDAWREARGAAAARDGGTGGAGDVSKSYRRVVLRGRFRHADEVLVGPRGPPPGALAESGPNSGRGGGGGMSSSAQGYWVIAPFIISDAEEDNATDEATHDVRKAVHVKQTGRWFDRIWGRKAELSKSSGISSHSDAATTTAANKSLDTNREENIVWINRGWIPRHYITKSNEVITPWLKTKGTVQLVAMESDTEHPGTFSPPSRLDSGQLRGKSTNERAMTVNKLLWMDRDALEELTSCVGDSLHPPLFVEIDDDEGAGPPRFPVKPGKELVGEFKVTPPIHAGYAATWFGLSGAGTIMTRRLLRRGR